MELLFFLAGIIGKAVIDITTALLTFGATYVQNINTTDTDTAEDWEKDVIDVLRDLQEEWERENGNDFVLEFYMESYLCNHEYTCTDEDKSPRDRIRDTMEEVGSTIFLITLTSTLAFTLELVSSIPAVNWLCLYPFPTIVINLFYCIKWFVALVVTDENQMQQNCVDCCVCFSAKKVEDGDRSPGIPEKTPSVANRIMTGYSDVLLEPVVMSGVCVGFLALLGGMAWQTSLLEQYFAFTDLTPSDFYVKTFIDALNDCTDLAGAQPGVYFRFEDQSIDLNRNGCVRQRLGGSR